MKWEEFRILVETAARAHRRYVEGQEDGRGYHLAAGKFRAAASPLNVAKLLDEHELMRKALAYIASWDCIKAPESECVAQDGERLCPACEAQNTLSKLTR